MFQRQTLAILGCGQVTESLHLPVAAQSEHFEVRWLVDANLERARQLAGLYGVASTAADYREVLGRVDAAIVALPNQHHAPVTVDLLRHGAHVLVEKPMALCTADCDAMIDAAQAHDRVLAVGLVRRLFAASQFVKQAIDHRLLGEISRFDLREGGIFSWRIASDFMFRKEAGGGLLADIGVHALDLVLSWFGDVETVRYFDDAAGGVEAECELRLAMRSGIQGFVELSRLRKMRNSCIIHGERGTLEVGTGAHANLRLRLKSGAPVLSGEVLQNERPDRLLIEVFQKQINDFAMALRYGTPPCVTGCEGRRAVALIEACARVREPLNRPWTLARPTETRELVA